jgi:signal transduction histidine kinase
VSKSNAENRSYTEKLELQNKLLLETNEELQRAAQARTELLARLSHDSRKTLNVIIGFTELMLDEKTGKINQEQRASLNDVLSGSRRLLYLINSYLE